MVPDLYLALQPVLDAFQRLGIPYHIGGSVASSALGVARTTLDVDLVADIGHDQVPNLVSLLENGFYVDREVVEQAVQERVSFNLIHQATVLKIDVFQVGDSDYARASLRKRRKDRLVDDNSPEVYIASPEDVVLHKLDWYRKENQISDRQWSDLVGVLKIQQATLDWEYLRMMGRADRGIGASAGGLEGVRIGAYRLIDGLR